jgi:hypothetical protein
MMSTVPTASKSFTIVRIHLYEGPTVAIHTAMLASVKICRCASILGPMAFLDFLDQGADVLANSDPKIRVANLTEWAEVVKRLHVPNYEEARRFFSVARNDGSFDGLAMLTQKSLEHVVQTYAERLRDGI